MNVVFFGPPGAGKGTQAVKACEKYGLFHVSTGQMLREERAKGSELGERVRSVMDKGELVDDALVISVVENIFLEKPSIGSTLFDGFPRTLKQAEALDVMMARLERKIDKVVEIRVSDSFLIARMSGRLFCSGCGTTYHREFNPAKRVGICDNCGVKLITRSDDEEIVVESRLELYHAESVPLLDYYRAEGKLVVVDGEGSIDQIAERVTSVLTVIKL